jgi:hypothetical protein
MDNKEEIKKILRNIKNQEHKSTKTISYKGDRQVHNAYDIDLSLLRFNPYNDRIHTDIKEFEYSKGIDFMSLPVEEMNNIISEMIWEKSKGKNEITLKDIREKQQIEVGVITSDGLIVDGNRRFMLLRKIQESGESRPFRAIILDETYEDDPASKYQIKLLELSLQDGEDKKEDYNSIDQYMRIIDFVDAYVETNNKRANYSVLAKQLNKSESQIKKMYQIGKMMQRYLKHIKCENVYSRLRKKEELFIKLYGTHKNIEKGGGKTPWKFDPADDADDYETIGFDLIRWGYNPKADKGDWTTSRNLRDIYFIDSKENTIFSNKRTWNDFKDKVFEFTTDPENREKSVIDYCNERGLSLKEAAEARDVDWAQKISNTFKGALGKAENRIKDLKNTDYPDKIIAEALDKLKNLIDEDVFEFQKNRIVLLENTITLIKESDENKEALKNIDLIRKISELIKREID